MKKKHYKKRFLFKKGNCLTPVKVKCIAYFYGDEIVFAKCFNGKSYPIDESLNYLQESVNPNLFLRINRQLLVNVNVIIKLISFKPEQLSIELNPKHQENIYLSQE